jgi:hypothetical protein
MWLYSYLNPTEPEFYPNCIEKFSLYIALYTMPLCYTVQSMDVVLGNTIVYFVNDAKHTYIYIYMCVCVCVCVSNAAQHPMHTLQTETFIATAQQQF